jgi:hypothetical protein
MIPSPANIIDLVDLFKKQFGSKPFVIDKDGKLSNDPGQPFQIKSDNNSEKEFTAKGSLIKENINGVDILLPVRFYDGPQLLMHLPYVVVSIRNRKNIISTPMVERIGSVIEQYNVDNYSMVVKGFLISEDRKFPEELITLIRDLYTNKSSVVVDNALFNIFLTFPELPQDEQRRVVIVDYDFPEVTGGRHAKPFILNLISDTVFTLELDN